MIAWTLSGAEVMADEPRSAPSESVSQELVRLRRLVTVEELLATLVGTLDIRDVSARLSEVIRRVLDHDAISLPVVTEDRAHVAQFATAGPASGDRPEAFPIPEAARRLFTEQWDFEIVDTTPADTDHHPIIAPTGFQSMLRVPVRLPEGVAGLLVLLSRSPATYNTDDAVVAGRIADYVALALSHQRLSDRARAADQLRARQAAAELLDDLLASFIGTGDLPDVFDRISAIARRVLAHDTLALWLTLPDGRRARIYASSGVGDSPFPEVFELPEGFRADTPWDHVIHDDIPTDPVFGGREAARRGYRSALRIAVRVEGRLVGGLVFFSFAPAAFQEADLLVARRIRDRLVLHLTQGRGAEAARRAAEATERATQLELRVRALTEELNARSGHRRIVGASDAWRQVLSEATQVAATDTTVLLLGESGTGKEIVARFIHRASSRRDGPFVGLNCAALPEHLLEAELFGYERGAFTGAAHAKPGQIEQATGGVLFLDEVAEMSVSAQAKFLRVLEEREFQRLGGTRVLKTEARIVAATNRDLRKAMERGRFREDLYYRLNVFTIRLPALRERPDDVLPLTEAFVEEIGRGIGRPPAGVSREARDALLAYSWPGNVRELRNVLERAAILCDGGLITAEHLALEPSPRSPTSGAARTISPAVAVPVTERTPGDLKSMERALITRALRDAHFNKSRAARSLGLTRAQLYVRLRKYGLDKDTTGQD